MNLYKTLLLKRAFFSSLWTALGSSLLFILIDLSSHLWIFYSGDLFLIGSFALAQLSKMLPMITGFAVLVGTLTAILQLHARGEITALRACGLSKRALLWPLFLSSLLFSCLNLANYEWLYPTASEKLQAIKRKHRPGKRAMQSLSLSPGEYLIFQSQNSGLIHDAFLLLKEEILHCQTIDTTTKPPIAHFVDRFTKEPTLTHTATEKCTQLSNIQYLDKKLLDARDPDTLSISQLTKGALWRRSFALALQAKLLLMALAPMAAFLASATLPFRSRLQSRTRTYCLAISMYLIYILVLNSSLFLISSLTQLPWGLLWLLPLPLAIMYSLFENLENKYSN